MVSADELPPQPLPPQPNELSDDCPMLWRLDGAEFAAGTSEEAVFNEKWKPNLVRLAQCLKRPEHNTTCAYVQGRWDEVKFTKGLIDVFGSENAVQSQRARARAAKVVSTLYELGVYNEQLRETPPPSTPSYRGVEVSLQPYCILRKANVDKQVQKAITEHNAPVLERIQRIEEATSQMSEPPPPIPPPPAREHHLYLGAGLDLGMNAGNYSTSVSGAGRLGVGYETEPVSSRLELDFGFGSAKEQAVHLGGYLALDYVIRPWLQLGLGGAFRIATLDASIAYLEQHFSVGVDVLSCVFKPTRHTDLCVTGFLSPGGVRVRRGEYDATARVLRIPEVSEYLVRFDVGVLLRWDLLGRDE